MTCVDLDRSGGIEPYRTDGRIAKQAARYAFFAAIGAVFVAGAVATIALGRSMAAMPDLPMPGGWSLSPVWLPASTCGQSWLGAAAAFVGMWTAMMIPMMLPALTPTLWRYWKRAGHTGHRDAARSTLWVGIGYFFTWALLGTIAFAVGSTLAAHILRSTAVARSMPMFMGIIVLLSGCAQFTAWKARCMARRERPPPDASFVASTRLAACEHGLMLGAHCCCRCANLIAVMFCFGVMDPIGMACATALMTAEPFAPAKLPTVKSIGLILVAVGFFRIVRAAALS